MSTKRIIVGISGASGAIYGIRLLELLADIDIETHLIITDSARITIALETNYSYEVVKGLADVCYSDKNIAASISSGSFCTVGMIIAPCSIKSMSDIANCSAGNLLTRSADVVLKERRKLVLMLRETPLHSGHLKNMLTVSENGAIIAPPVPAFYIKPQTIDEIVTQSVCRVLDLFDIKMDATKRWKNDGQK